MAVELKKGSGLYIFQDLALRLGVLQLVLLDDVLLADRFHREGPRCPSSAPASPCRRRPTDHPDQLEVAQRHFLLEGWGNTRTSISDYLWL